MKNMHRTFYYKVVSKIGEYYTETYSTAKIKFDELCENHTQEDIKLYSREKQ